MSKRAGPPLRKITINLYDEDVREMERIYQWGWSEKVRELIHNHLVQMKQRLNNE